MLPASGRRMIDMLGRRRPETPPSAMHAAVTPAESPRKSHQPKPGDPAFGYVILFLTVAGFVVSLNIRITDPLLPLLADEFLSTPGKVAIVSVFYAVAHGFMQLAGGPVGDRFGKLRVVTICTYAAAVATAMTALAGSIPELAALRLLSGATAAIVFPLAFAWVGDVVVYEKRQVLIARMFGGAMLGAMTGQAVSGIFADFLGWRAVFILAGGIFLLAAIGLTYFHGLSRDHARRTTNPGLLADIFMPFRLLGKMQPRWVIGVSAAEGFFVISAAAFLGAYMHDQFGLSYSQIGLALALFGGGGLFYTLNAGWLIKRYSERELVGYGGVIFSVSFFLVALTPWWQAIPVLLFLSGVSLLMLHNTLQLRASQMAPEARGSAMSAFAASFFIGQLVGIAICGPFYDRIGGAPVIAAGAVGFAIVALIYWARLPTLDTKS
jgi:MFS transporter, YNFM family, putative membrane transport protein